jgi:hypothetical protein
LIPWNASNEGVRKEKRDIQDLRELERDSTVPLFLRRERNVISFLLFLSLLCFVFDDSGVAWEEQD